VTSNEARRASRTNRSEDGLALLSQELQRFLRDTIRGDAELFVENLVRGRGAEVIDAYHISLIADIATPPWVRPASIAMRTLISGAMTARR